MGPNNIVLRPGFAQFQFPALQFTDLATVPDIIEAANQTLLPVTTGLLELPEVDPAKYAIMSLHAKFFYRAPNTVVSSWGVLNARPKRNEVVYTVDGIAQRSNVTEDILIEKGSVRNINITQLLGNFVVDLINFQSTLAFVPDVSGTDGAAFSYLSPVVTLWY